jgi:hypothetical protein
MEKIDHDIHNYRPQEIGKPMQPMWKYEINHTSNLNPQIFWLKQKFH